MYLIKSIILVDLIKNNRKLGNNFQFLIQKILTSGINKLINQSNRFDDIDQFNRFSLKFPNTKVDALYIAPVYSPGFLCDTPRFRPLRGWYGIKIAPGTGNDCIGSRSTVYMYYSVTPGISI